MRRSFCLHFDNLKSLFPRKRSRRGQEKDLKMIFRLCKISKLGTCCNTRWIMTQSRWAPCRKYSLMIDVSPCMEYFQLEMFDGFEQARKVEGESLLELTAAPSRPRGIQSIAPYRGSRERRGCRGSRERRGCRQAWMLGSQGNRVCPLPGLS